MIGAKTFTEQYILSEILAGQIRPATVPRRAVVSSLGSTVAFDALRSGDIDVYVDYSGTIWTTLMHRETIDVEPRAKCSTACGSSCTTSMASSWSARWASRTPMPWRCPAPRPQRWAPRASATWRQSRRTLGIGGDYEFFGRPEWKSIADTYGLKFREQRSMDSSLMYQAAASGQVDVISAFSTDGRIAAFDLTVLEDDRGAIPPYDAIILAGPRLVREHPDVIAALRELTGTIDADHMRRMNRAVDEDGATPAAVAREFLRICSAESRSLRIRPRARPVSAWCRRTGHRRSRT